MDEILNHLGEERLDYKNAVSPPVFQTSNFMFTSIEDLRHKLVHEEHEHVYTRGNNPTVEILRKKVAALEKTEDALVTSSGAAAIAISILHFVKAGDHILCVQKPYTWTYQLIHSILSKFGVTYDFVEMTTPDDVEKYRKPSTKLLYLESPNSLTFEIQDLKALAQWAKKHNIITIIDNSYCSPVFQNPATMGIDIVVHSATKYINGHSDVVGGIICGSRKHISSIFKSPFMSLGCNISPHDAWLMIRGMRTLPLRIYQSDKTAREVIAFLEGHHRIKRIIQPFHPSHPQNELAKKQMKGCGGLFTIELIAHKKEEVEKFINTLQRFLIAVSWGGYESLVFPVLALPDRPDMDDPVLPWTMVRIYIGLESANYLIEDLQKALDAMEDVVS